jgi:hypothetical protein
MKLLATVVATAMASPGSQPDYKETTFAVAGQPARRYVMHWEMHTNWQQSVDHCKAAGMQLVEFESQEMYDKVWEWLGDGPYADGANPQLEPGYWIGYKEKNGVVKPASGRDFEAYTAWWSGEPNDTLNPGQNDNKPGNEACVRMRKKDGETGTMNDAPCNFTWAGPKNDSIYMSFICQDTYEFPDPTDPPTEPGEAPLCPSEFLDDGSENDGCYVQNLEWYANMPDDIICTMKNDACLNVSCSAGGIYAELRHDLFHENLKHPGRFTDQLELGQAVLTFGGQEVTADGPCPYKISADGEFVILDWSYDECDVKPELAHSDSCDGDGNNAIQYKVSVKSFGNDRDSSNVIEFYVDTTVDASCTYCNSIVIDADGFWVNQEDVSAVAKAAGDFESIFNCNLYADAARQDKIEEHNIVNMGEYIYGEVTSSLPLPGLKYKLVEFKVSDASVHNKGDFLVIADGNPESIVDAQIPGGNSANVGDSVLFSYLSFGFENLSEQNELDHTCKIQVELA